ncbi:DUF742 domain-containing protein [Streptomyces peucetius]|uniref:DUF742 domain-containing protein n=1 Tax=Streptomyces peucetius TaxID=1950 RepID=A0ABY6IFA6_STRPE|nr:DUF742 domain-containing protein [Streptomyces peucetius]UYQ64609.1 DUF742 domain-containing protein [Streptomyces peucetius]
MATPPGGRPYEGGHQPHGEHTDNRFNFPPAPGREGAQSPYQQPQSPYQPSYDPAYGQHQPGTPTGPQGPGGAPRDQPTSPRRAQGPSNASGGGSGRHNPLVRPYAMTGGRTRPRYQLAIEALVSTTADPSRLQGQLPEHQRICRLCFEIKSVAEISALLSIPLGVARILVADLAEAGLVAIHQPGGDESAGGQPDVTLLERVLSGLRKL